MPTAIPLNGTRLNIRLIEVELSKLRLDPDNPRLHSAYLTHELSSRPSEKQIAQVLEQLPEFQPLLDSLMRNQGCHSPEQEKTLRAKFHLDYVELKVNADTCIFSPRHILGGTR